MSTNMSDANPQVGFVGLGNMGICMAVNLGNALAADKLPKLKVWNRTESKSQDVARETDGKVEAVQDVEQVASSCDIIFTSLANDTVVKNIYEQMLKAVRKDSGVLFIETSTVYPDLTKELERQVLAHGCQFCAALPFGQPPVAKTAQLVFAVGGKADSVKLASKYIVPNIGRKVMEFGEDPSKASAFKLIGNSFILSTVEMVSESMTLAEKAGIGADRVLEWINNFYPAPSAINYGNKVANLKFEASGGFDLKGGLKDATHIQKLGQQFDCPMHITETAIKHIESAIKANEGQENKDWAALVAGQRIESGLKPFG